MQNYQQPHGKSDHQTPGLANRVTEEGGAGLTGRGVLVRKQPSGASGVSGGFSIPSDSRKEGFSSQVASRQMPRNVDDSIRAVKDSHHMLNFTPSPAQTRDLQEFVLKKKHDDVFFS